MPVLHCAEDNEKPLKKQSDLAPGSAAKRSSVSRALQMRDAPQNWPIREKRLKFAEN
jgi:hypothetical protein